jgi:hypothetical protein
VTEPIGLVDVKGKIETWRLLSSRDSAFTSPKD